MISSCQQPGVFALTFDDGPHEYTSALLRLLARYNVKATFFLNGENYGRITSPASQAVVRDAYNQGHQIGSHTYFHRYLTRLSIEDMWNELVSLDNAIRNIIGVRPVYVRPPYGAVNDQVLTALGSWGYRAAWINLDLEDWKYLDQPDSSIALLNSALDNTTPSTSSFIGLLHDVHRETVEQMVERVIQSIQSRGYRLVTFGECNGQPARNWYR
jgi:peptidoglycan/xylan/chitin deacetylase (PgdA/CDA1 family)